MLHKLKYYILQMKLFSLVYSAKSICGLYIKCMNLLPIKHTHLHSMFFYCAVVGCYAFSAMLLVIRA